MQMAEPTSLEPDERAAVRRVLEDPVFELIPLSNVLKQAEHLPEGATVSITASPQKTLDDTLDLAAELQHRGFSTIPHLSARMTRDRVHLEHLLGRVADLEIHRAFVIGGDADFNGEFFDAHSLLTAMEEIGHDVGEIGIGSYPEGHHVFDEATALQALHDKQPFAAYMTTQMCFDGRAIGSWLGKVRSDGISLPVHIGLAGVADRIKLARISARIGVGASLKFLSKHRGLVRSLVGPGGYAPDELLEELAGVLAVPEANVVTTHIYTFNQVDTTEAWRQQYLEQLG